MPRQMQKGFNLIIASSVEWWLTAGGRNPQTAATFSLLQRIFVALQIMPSIKPNGRLNQWQMGWALFFFLIFFPLLDFSHTMGNQITRPWTPDHGLQTPDSRPRTARANINLHTAHIKSNRIQPNQFSVSRFDKIIRCGKDGDGDGEMASTLISHSGHQMASI